MPDTLEIGGKTRKTMAEKRPYARAFPVPEDEQEGYLTSVTPVMMSAKKNRYFNASLQTKSKDYKVVSFNEDKHNQFMTAQRISSPVKLRNFSLSPNSKTGDMDILVSTRTKVDFVQSLKFQKRLEFADTAPSTSGLGGSSMTITSINNIYRSTTQIMYNLKGKVISIGETKVVEMFGNTKEKKEIIIADSTGNVKVAVFENLIAELQFDNCCTLTNLSSRKYSDFYLTTTKSTKITVQDDDLGEINDDIEENELPEKIGQIQNIQIVKKFHCGSCNKKMNIPEGIKKIKCPHCNLKGNIESFQFKVTCRFNLKENKKSTHLVAFHDTMSDFLNSRNRSDYLNDIDQLEDYFLDIISINCTVNEDVVTQFAL